MKKYLVLLVAISICQSISSQEIIKKATLLWDTSYSMVDRNLDNDLDVLSADSTIVGINMFGVDVRYNTGPLIIKAQYVIANISNTEQYAKSVP